MDFINYGTQMFVFIAHVNRDMRLRDIRIPHIQSRVWVLNPLKFDPQFPDSSVTVTVLNRGKSIMWRITLA